MALAQRTKCSQHEQHAENNLHLGCRLSFNSLLSHASFLSSVVLNQNDPFLLKASSARRC